MLVRPMRPEDVGAAEELSGLAFAALPQVPYAPGDAAHPHPHPAADRWRRRAHHLLMTDAGGCWAAVTDEGVVAGAALSLRRGNLWGLSSLAVRPGLQGAGVGRALLERATAYGSGVLRGIVCASSDPRGVRLYRVFGHRIHPAMRMRGTVERTALPVVRHVRDARPSDVDFADAVD